MSLGIRAVLLASCGFPFTIAAGMHSMDFLSWRARVVHLILSGHTFLPLLPKDWICKVELCMVAGEMYLKGKKSMFLGVGSPERCLEIVGIPVSPFLTK